MIRIVRWNEWQGRAVYEATRRRKDKRRKVVLSYLYVTSDWDDRAVAFSARLRRDDGAGKARLAPKAAAYIVRVLQYVARHGAESGRLHVARSDFGAVVLTDRLGTATRREGERVYDALIECGIAVEDPSTYADNAAATDASPAAATDADDTAASAAVPDAASAARQLRPEVEVEGEETLPAVVSDVDVDRARDPGHVTDRGGLSPPSGEGTAPSEAPATPATPAPAAETLPPSVGSPPATPSETAAILAVVSRLPEDVHGRGGVGAPTWAREIDALLREGVAASAVSLALDQAGTAAKPWDAFRGLRDEVRARKERDAALEAERAKRLKAWEKRVDDLAALPSRHRVAYLATLDRYEGGPALREAYVKALRARGVEP